jgi:hypothetical protein
VKEELGKQPCDGVMDSATTTGRLPLHHDGGESGQEAVEEEEEEQQQQQQYSLAATSLLGTDPVINGSSRLEGNVSKLDPLKQLLLVSFGCLGFDGMVLRFFPTA